MTQEPVKPTKSTDRPASSRPPRTTRRKPSHGEIADISGRFLVWPGAVHGGN
jgi:hypothetical protein